jgi:putative ABC transport system permease protein
VNKFLEAIGIALSAIWSNKLRSLLTVLGNIVAVTSIIAVVSLIQGLNGAVSNAIVSQVGADSFQIQRRPITRTQEEEERSQANPLVTLDDAAAVKHYASLVRYVAAESDASGPISYRSQSLDSVEIQGYTRDYIYFPAFTAARGRLISATEFDRNRPVAVLGYDTADKLFGAADPIDKIVRIAGMHFRIIGISEKKGTVFGRSQDEFAIIPLGVFRKLFGTRPSLSILARPTDPSLVRPAMDEATMAMRIQRKLRPKDKDNFGVFAADTFMKLYETATKNLFAVLVGVVALSLVVGGIVIMNIMLMVVTERTREIGLRKALGARRRDIVWQILTESVTLSTFGGIVGTGLGFLLALAIARFTPLPAAVQFWSVMIGVGITAFVGLFFGLYPAMRAARLDPIEALRRE